MQSLINEILVESASLMFSQNIVWQIKYSQYFKMNLYIQSLL